MKRTLKRFTIFALIIILLITIGAISCRSSRINHVETNLGISIPAWTSVSGSTELLGQDYEKVLNLKFTENGMNELISHIEQTKYFNLNHTFHGCNSIEWKKSDTAFFRTMIKDLREIHLTGYWMRTDSSTLVFHQPDLGDIPNSAILFDEAYTIEAELFLNDRRMLYRFIKF